MIAAKPDRTQEHSGVRRASGRTYDEWFALLDRWGAPGRPFGRSPTGSRASTTSAAGGHRS